MSTATAQRRLRIVIADDHPSIRENLRYLIGVEADLEVVGVVRDGMSALRLARKLRPDVLVIDHDMPDYSGLTVAQALRREARGPRVLLYTMDTEACAHAKHAGVLCVNKDASPKVLLEAIRTLGRKSSQDRTRVLVVEDDADVRGAIRTALQDDGLEIVETRDGVEALAECERQDPGVVVLDLGLPRMSGQQFVAAYRNLPKHEAPIVVLSAVRDARKIARDIGAAAFLPKPFVLNELTQAVRGAAANAR